MIKNLILLSIKVIFFCYITLLFCYNAYSIEKLRISSIPDESITVLHKKFKPLVKFLESRLNIPVEFVPVTDYATVVEALINKKIDLAWLGGFTFVQASIRSQNNVEAIIQREKDSRFTSVFIVNKKSKISSLEQLKNKPFSFGSPSSTSGHIMPRYFLYKKNISPEDFFKPIAYSGAHDATIFSVHSGKVSGGVLNSLVWEKFKIKKKEIVKDLDVIYETPDYHDYNWTIRKGIDSEIKKKIILSFLILDKKKPDHKEILSLQRANKYVKTNNNNYLEIKKSAVEIGILK